MTNAAAESDPLVPSSSSKPRLLSYDESIRLVPWQTDNHDILSGYRPQLFNLRACIWSAIGCKRGIVVTNHRRPQRDRQYPHPQPRCSVLRGPAAVTCPAGPIPNTGCVPVQHSNHRHRQALPRDVFRLRVHLPGTEHLVPHGPVPLARGVLSRPLWGLRRHRGSDRRVDPPRPLLWLLRQRRSSDSLHGWHPHGGHHLRLCKFSMAL